jgi:formate-dependent nitrite reductase membrane component NrfD
VNGDHDPRSDGRRRDGAGAGPGTDVASYYGRPVIKSPVWEWGTAAYLFTGGLAAGTAVLAAGADLLGLDRLRRVSWLGSFGALLASVGFLIDDLGRPERFHHMLRVAKPTSPMSIGTWLLTAFGPGVGAAAVWELLPARWRSSWPARLLRGVSRGAGLTSAATAPAVATYTAALLSQTAVPGWNEVRGELPFVFAGSAAAAGGGFGMLAAPLAEARPARVFAAVGAAGELVASRVMEQRMGLIGEVYHSGTVGRRRRAAELLTVAGLAGTVLLAGRSRAGAAASGIALVCGSAFQRFGVFEAGVASTKDPRYTVVPQRERLDAAARDRAAAPAPADRP